MFASKPRDKDKYHSEKEDGYVISWVGYVKLLIRCSWILVLSLFLPIIFPITIPIFILSFTYKALQMRTVRVFANQEGVWLTSGLFPWQRARSGVRWHNVDEATSSPGLISWLTKAYPICVTNRYTKSLEVFIPCIAHGNEFVHRVNSVIGNHYRSDLIIEPITRKNGYRLPRNEAPAVE